MELTIILPCYNEIKYIENCINSILKNDFKGEYEFLIIDGFSNDGTREIIKKYCEKHENIKLIDNPQRSQVYALNLGIERAKGDYLMRIDAHCEFPQNYISEILKFHKENKVNNVGACIDTLPGNNSLKAIAISEVMNNPFGMGGGTFRTIKNKNKFIQVDTVPFGCWKKSDLKEFGSFDEFFISDEDYEHNVRIIKKKGKIILLPWLIIKYFTRENFRKIRKMFFQYGYWRPFVNKKHRVVTNIRQLLPGCFVGGIIFLILLSFFHLFFLKILCIYMLLYLISIFVLCFLIKIKKKKRIFFLTLLSFLIIHFSYGLGSLKGYFDCFILRKKTIDKKMKKITR